LPSNVSDLGSPSIHSQSYQHTTRFYIRVQVPFSTLKFTFLETLKSSPSPQTHPLGPSSQKHAAIDVTVGTIQVMNSGTLVTPQRFLTSMHQSEQSVIETHRINQRGAFSTEWRRSSETINSSTGSSKLTCGQSETTNVEQQRKRRLALG
jgi:hypothetical protein